MIGTLMRVRTLACWMLVFAAASSHHRYRRGDTAAAKKLSRKGKVCERRMYVLFVCGCGSSGNTQWVMLCRARVTDRLAASQVVHALTRQKGGPGGCFGHVSRLKTSSWLAGDLWIVGRFAGENSMQKQQTKYSACGSVLWRRNAGPTRWICTVR